MTGEKVDLKRKARMIGQGLKAKKAPRLAQKGHKTQSEMVETAFREASKRTGTFASKYAK